MTQSFLGCGRGQALLLAPSLDEWLPADHFARFVIAAVETMDLAAFYADYRADGNGRPAHDPSMMVALLVYAYARGKRSSRVIERGCIGVYELEPGAVGSPLRVHHANFVKPRASRIDALTTAPGDSRGFDPPY